MSPSEPIPLGTDVLVLSRRAAGARSLAPALVALLLAGCAPAAPPGPPAITSAVAPAASAAPPAATPALAWHEVMDDTVASLAAAVPGRALFAGNGGVVEFDGDKLVQREDDFASMLLPGRPPEVGIRYGFGPKGE